MRTKQRRKTRAGGLVVPVITGLFLAYFALQAQTGRYGLEAKREFVELLERREGERMAVVREREALERRVRLLNDGTLERDMLDERARRALNVGNEDEIVILR